MSAPFAAIARRLTAGEAIREEDASAILGLVGYEVAPHGRLGLACRPVGDSHWQSVPYWRDTDAALLWTEKSGARIEGAGRPFVDDEPAYYAGIQHPDYGNDFGEGPTLGLAIWAAFVRLLGRVDDEAGS